MRELAKVKLRSAFMAFLIALIGSLVSVTGNAQTDQGTITGLIRDATGAVVEGATVVLTNADTGLKLTRSTDSSGSYTFSPVKIGNYELSVASNGFQTAIRKGIHLDIQQRLEVDLALSLSSTNETVAVTTEAPLMQTEDASTGQVVTAKTIDLTPLNGRNYVFIAQLTAGVDPANGSRGQGTGDFTANGQRVEQNNFILDGVDNNTAVVDFLNGATYSVRPPPDALAEFKVQTGSYDAEFGHAAGAVINASIKSGTNQIHGDFWEYLRNDKLDATDFNATSVPRYRQNQFGGTLGFPVLRNKLFFFADTEANRIIFGNPLSNFSVPSDRERNGDFSELLNPQLTGSAAPIRLYQPGSQDVTMPVSCGGRVNVFCNGSNGGPNQLNPVAQNLLKLFPEPNANNGALYNNYQFQSKSSSNTFQFDGRVDWNPTTKDQAYSRFSYSNQLQYFPPPLGPILDGGTYGADGNVNAFGENFMLSETHAFSSNLLNEFRFGYNYGHFSDTQPNANVNIAAQVGLGGIPYAPLNGGLPFTSIAGLGSSSTLSGEVGFGATLYYAANEYQNVFQILDNVTRTQGHHTIKAGVNFQHLRFYTLAPPEPRGGYTYDGTYTGIAGTSFTGSGLADFLVDYQRSAAISNLSGVDDVQWNDAAYVEDSWKASPSLTVNFGVRYEFWQPYKERHDRQASVIPTSPLSPGATMGQFVLPASNQATPLPAAFTSLLSKSNVSVYYDPNRELTEGQNKNFAPRLGIAYTVNNRLTVRSGYGLFYGGQAGLGGANTGFSYPFQFSDNFQSTAGCTLHNCPTDGIQLATGFSQQIAAGLLNSVSFPGFNAFDKHIKTEYSQQFNLAAQYGIRNDLVATASYVGSVGRHVWTSYNLNSSLALVAPGVNTVGYQAFPLLGGITRLAPIASSSYNSLQATLEKRSDRGLSFLATYTYAHSLDDAADPLGTAGDAGYRAPLLIGIGSDYSNSVFDTRHRVTFNGNYTLPFGRGRKYLNQSRLADYVVGGWAASLAFRAQTGQPFSLSPSNATVTGGGAHPFLVRDPFQAGGSPDPTNPGITCPTKVKTLAHWYNPCAFANPPNATAIAQGQTVTGLAALPFLGGPRNNVYGPGYDRVDMSLFKAFPIFREQALQFRGDVFNLFNTPSWGNPNGSIGQNGGNISSPRYFQVNTPNARFFQVALKYVF